MGKQVDKNDFWFIEKNPITKVGVYPYLGKQISQDCEPDKIYYVLRPKEELFRKETLDSLRLIPLIDGHTMIGKDFTAPEDKGLDGTLGDNVSHDTDTIYNDLKIISNKMKEEIKNGKKELSLGYFCRYDKQPGTYKGQRYDYVQRDIIANHLALVDKGRMGADVRVYDSKNIPEGEAFAMDSIDIAIDKDEDIEWITVRGTHVPIKKGESKEQAVKKFLESKKSSSGIKGSSEKLFHKGEIVTPEQSEAQFKEDDFVKTPKGVAKISQIVRGKLSDTPYYKVTFEDGKTATYLEEELEPDTEQSGSKAEPERKEQNPFEKTLSKSGFKKDDNNYSYTKEYADGTTISVHSEKNDDSGKFYIADIVDKNGNMSQKEYHYQGIEDVFNKLNKEYEKSEPENKKRTSEQRALENYEFTKNKDNSYQKEYKNGLKVVVRKDQDKRLGIYHVAEITDKYGNTEKKLFPTENTETVFRSIDRDKDIGKQTTEETTTTKNTSKEEMKIFVANKGFFDDRIKKPQEFKKELNKTFEEIYTDKTGRRYGEKKDRVATFKDIYEEAVKRYLNKDKGTQDSMEYKTIQGEGNMADKKEKVAIDEDKRKIIDEIGGILKDAGLDDELIRTVIGKAEKIAYNASEASKADDEDAEKKGEKKEEEKKPAKDKCGKDEEGKEVEEKDKEEEEKKKVVKAFAQKEKLGKEVEDALGTFDHSEMTELEIAKYACDKLDLEVEKGQEISAVKGYLKGLAKAPKATFGYKTVAADSGIQKEDAEFEKFVNKGE